MSIKLKVNGYEYNNVDTFTFPGGEVNVNFLKNHKGLRKMPKIDRVVIEAHLRNAEDILELLFVKDAIDRWLLTKQRRTAMVIALDMPYIPYARQDRVCNKGESFSLKVFANLINDMNFDTVIVHDAHSTVATALINNVVEASQADIIAMDKELSNKLRSGKYVIVSPDAGAEKKALQVAQEFGCNMIRATKRRDISTGKIQEIGFIDPIPEDRSFLIVDDICDGGGTFIPLAGELAKHNAKSVELYATHGIFSKGTQILLDCFDTIYTTDSYYEGESTNNIKVITL